ncbi:MAG TPA: polysaccharide deacetylase family protein [Chthoniobacterales bacterium]|jgi:peptidoglycan/xylan/chitin deacetylase (PgdA/CDA1 family)
MRKIAILLSVVLLCVPGCKKQPQPVAKPAPPPAPLVVATPTPAPTATPPAAIQANKDARVVVLCYHRFEAVPDSLAIKPEEFEKQMAALKDNGITVIGMQDFLAWRRNEKVIPPKAAVITIDDGYLSGYEVAWPILKKFGYPFTMFVYTDYIKGGAKSGGKSVSWEQLAEMRDAGVDIQSHTVSHSDLRSKKAAPDYDKWLESEFGDSKRNIENQLGVQVTALAYPYGLHNETVRAAGLKAGYEALFTVYGQTLGWGVPSDAIGRYAIESTKPQVFANAIRFQGGPVQAATGDAPVSAQLASASMITEPQSGSTINEPKPIVRANLATMGELDPASVEMWISGFGLVPSKYDTATKMISYQVGRNLHPDSYKVIVSGRVKGKKVETQWSFTYAR